MLINKFIIIINSKVKLKKEGSLNPCLVPLRVCDVIMYTKDRTEGRPYLSGLVICIQLNGMVLVLPGYSANFFLSTVQKLLYS